ncbi:MAG: IS3 family transposase, partial [Bacteroidota bacterium]
MLKQCEEAGVPRSSWYYEPCGEQEENLLIKRLKDEQYTKTPFYRSPLMYFVLRQRIYQINEKRVERLMRLMGIQAIYPNKNLTKAVKE